jgi:hypothetical protein
MLAFISSIKIKIEKVKKILFLLTDEEKDSDGQEASKPDRHSFQRLLPLSGQMSTSISLVYTRVARWFVFKPKVPIKVNFGRSCYGKSWYIL